MVYYKLNKRAFFIVKNAHLHYPREEQIPIPPVPQENFFHIFEGDGGKHYEPNQISTSSLREG